MRKGLKEFKANCISNGLNPSKVREFFRLYSHETSRWDSNKEVNNTICIATDDHINDAISHYKKD